MIATSNSPFFSILLCYTSSIKDTKHVFPPVYLLSINYLRLHCHPSPSRASSSFLSRRVHWLAAKLLKCAFLPIALSVSRRTTASAITAWSPPRNLINNSKAHSTFLPSIRFDRSARERQAARRSRSKKNKYNKRYHHNNISMHRLNLYKAKRQQQQKTEKRSAKCTTSLCLINRFAL